MTAGLSLIAKDDEDLALVAACLQDALVPVSDMRYEPNERRFYMIVNRFLWERAPKGEPAAADNPKRDDDAAFADPDEPKGPGRRNAAIRIDNVASVRAKGVDLGQRGGFLSLLTVQRDNNRLNFIFSGGGAIQIEISDLALLLRDLGAAWPTQWRPDHGSTEQGGT
jgi:hypothetical protein